MNKQILTSTFRETMKIATLDNRVKAINDINTVKKLLIDLKPNCENYLEKAKDASLAYEALSTDERQAVNKQVLLMYRYFDAKEATKKNSDLKVSMKVLSDISLLDKNNSKYIENAKHTLAKYKALTPSQINILMLDKKASILVDTLKVELIIERFASLNDKSPNYFNDAKNALEEYKYLSYEAKDIIEVSPKGYLVSKVKVDFVKVALMKFDYYGKDRKVLGEIAISEYTSLNSKEKSMLENDALAMEKLSEVRFMFDRFDADDMIGRLRRAYALSKKNTISVDYFFITLDIVSDFEALSDDAKELVEIEATRELNAAKDGKEAHPIVHLLEAMLPESTEDKNYLMIGEILVAAYDFILTDKQKALVNKSVSTLAFLEEARKELNSKFNVNEFKIA